MGECQCVGIDREPTLDVSKASCGTYFTAETAEFPSEVEERGKYRSTRWLPDGPDELCTSGLSRETPLSLLPESHKVIGARECHDVVIAD